jgi:basic membrane protein A
MSSLRIVLALAALACLVTFLPARQREPVRVARSNVRIGLVFDVGGRGDKSFNDSAYAGLVRAEEQYGVQIAYLEPAGAEDREAALRLFAAQGMDLVIGVGFIFSSDVNEVAHTYPDIHFACVDYAPSGPVPPNVAGLAFREEEGSYLVGGVAGTLSRTGHVGFVGGMTIPLIRKFEAGYIAGVKAVCPSCEVHSGYAGASPEAFKDPAKGKLLAKAQIGAGADVIFHASGSTGHGVFEGAREGGALAIGVDADQHDEMPGVVVTSMVKRVDVAVAKIIGDVVAGHFTGGMRQLGLAEEGIDYVHEGPHAAGLSKEVIDKVEGLRQDVIAGRVNVPFE